MPKTTKKAKVWTNVRIEKEVYSRLKKLAGREGESLTQIINSMIYAYEDFLADHKWNKNV